MARYSARRSIACRAAADPPTGVRNSGKAEVKVSVDRMPAKFGPLTLIVPLLINMLRAGGRDGALIGKRAAVPGARNPEGIETRYAHHSLIEPRAVVDHADRAGRRAQDRTGQQRIRSVGPKTSFL